MPLATAVPHPSLRFQVRVVVPPWRVKVWADILRKAVVYIPTSRVEPLGACTWKVKGPVP